jgi:hypothetical protein
VIKRMDRLPVVITLGGMLLGWIAGTMAVGGPALASVVPQTNGDASTTVHYAAGIIGALLVLAVDLLLRGRGAGA